MSVHQCSQIATQLLHITGTGKHVLLLTNVGWYLIFIREDGFSRSLNSREENALVPVIFLLSCLSTSAPCQRSLKSKTKTSWGILCLKW